MTMSAIIAVTRPFTAWDGVRQRQPAGIGLEGLPLSVRTAAATARLAILAAYHRRGR